MDKVIFALLLVGFNVVSFLLLDVGKMFDINKQKLIVVFLLILVTIVISLVFIAGEYIATSFYISMCLFCLQGLKFVLYKLFSLPPERENKGRLMMRKVFDSYLFPFFILYMSFMQCMYLLVWSS